MASKFKLSLGVAFVIHVWYVEAFHVGPMPNHIEPREPSWPALTPPTIENSASDFLALPLRYTYR